MLEHTWNSQALYGTLINPSTLKWLKMCSVERQNNYQCSKICPERLRKVKLPTLTLRRICGDMKELYKILSHTCEPSDGSIFLPILRVPSVPPVNFQNLQPVKKIKYNKILTYILRSIFLEIPHLELQR